MSRISFGVFAMLTVGWYLWPRETPIIEREEAMFAFIIAFIVWVMVEVKESEEVIFRRSTLNDIRLARDLLSYASNQFRTILKDHDFHRGINPRYLSEIGALVHEWEVGVSIFQDRILNERFAAFCGRLALFDGYLGIHSSPERFGSVVLQSVVPARVYDEMNISQQHRLEIEEVNRLASLAWNEFIPLISAVRERVPEAFDEVIGYKWFRSRDEFADH